MRGLKHNRTVSHITYFGSHLLQMRGLKLVFLALLVLISVSHLLQMRGLKLKRTEHNKVTQSRIFYRCVDWNHPRKPICSSRIVASFTDAWIETRTGKYQRKYLLVASFTDAWIETVTQNPHFVQTDVASFTDAWIETKDDEEEVLEPCRIFYRCVDWNVDLAIIVVNQSSRIFYRCVDWNSLAKWSRH